MMRSPYDPYAKFSTDVTAVATISINVLLISRIHEKKLGKKKYERE